MLRTDQAGLNVKLLEQHHHLILTKRCSKSNHFVKITCNFRSTNFSK